MTIFHLIKYPPAKHTWVGDDAWEILPKEVKAEYLRLRQIQTSTKCWKDPIDSTVEILRKVLTEYEGSL